MESVKKMPVPSDDDVDMIVTRAATAPNYHDRGTTSIAPGALTSSSTLGNYRVERPQHRNRGSTARARSMPPSVTAPIAPSMNLRRRQRQLESRWAAGILTVLNMEFQDHLHTKVQLKDMAAALEAEKMAHRETQHQLEKKLHDADSMRKSWLEAANHLDRALRQGQAVNQMTDDELIHKAEALRFKIKNFALQFFGDELKTIEQSHATVDLLRTHLNLSPRSLKVYLRSSSLRPMLVRSFLWCYLRKAVFGRFRWVPHESSTAMLDLDRFLSTFCFLSRSMHVSQGLTYTQEILLRQMEGSSRRTRASFTCGGLRPATCFVKRRNRRLLLAVADKNRLPTLIISSIYWPRILRQTLKSLEPVLSISSIRAWS